MSADVSIA